MDRRELIARHQGDLPARLTVEHVASHLGCSTEGVYVLTKRRLLKPLGRPPPNGTKYYARAYILRLCEDEAWLARASDALVDFKWLKNHGEARKGASE
jgi:hypothetical protein